MRPAFDHELMIIVPPSSAKWTARLFFVLIGLFIGPIMLFIVNANDLPTSAVCAVAAGIVLFGGGCFFWAHYFFKRLVTWAALGDDFHFQTKSSERRVPWNEVARFILGGPDSPIWGLSIINVLLTDGTKLAIWTKTAQAESALELVRTKPWAKEWEGKPLEWGVAFLAMLLGFIALSTGAIAGYWLLEYNYDPTLFPREFPFDPRLQMLAAFGGPLLGIGAVGFSFYHLIRWPIFCRAAVKRSNENASHGPWQQIKDLFSRPE